MRVFDWWFRDRRTGRITIAQAPNIPLWIFLATVVLRLFVTTGNARTGLDIIAGVSLVWWALDELLRGVNPWRRLLGLVVCGFVVVGLFR
jgi:hypothetical protein